MIQKIKGLYYPSLSIIFSLHPTQSSSSLVQRALSFSPVAWAPSTGVRHPPATALPLPQPSQRLARPPWWLTQALWPVRATMPGHLHDSGGRTSLPSRLAVMASTCPPTRGHAPMAAHLGGCKSRWLHAPMHLDRGKQVSWGPKLHVGKVKPLFFLWEEVLRGFTSESILFWQKMALNDSWSRWRSPAKPRLSQIIKAELYNSCLLFFYRKLLLCGTLSHTLFFFESAGEPSTYFFGFN